MLLKADEFKPLLPNGNCSAVAYLRASLAIDIIRHRRQHPPGVAEAHRTIPRRIERPHRRKDRLGVARGGGGKVWQNFRNEAVSRCQSKISASNPDCPQFVERSFANAGFETGVWQWKRIRLAKNAFCFTMQSTLHPITRS